MDDRIETGSCFCGAVAAEMRGEPFWICFDHDDDCRRAIGGPLNVRVGYRTSQFRVTSGQPKAFSKPKVSSGRSAPSAAPRSATWTKGWVTSCT